MRNLILIILLLVFGGYVVAQVAKIYKARTDLTERVEYHLGFVDNTSIGAVQQDVIHDARKFGIELTPANITVLYEDTEQQSMAQQMVGGRLGASFVNKRAVISVSYTARILGVPWQQEIVKSRIKQTQTAPLAPQREALDVINALP